MANFYTEVPELKFQLNNPMMERICELKERGYQDKDKFDYAPQDYTDAMDSYDKVLEITGEITGEIINPNAEGVDEEGPHCANGRVEYASGTRQNLDAMVQFRIEILDLLSREFLMLTQVEIRTAMYTLHFLESERHLELDIRSGVSVVSQLLMIVITILLISQAKSLMPF